MGESNATNDTEITEKPGFIGTVIDGRYRVVARIAGGDAQVELYTGVQLSLDRTVLIKVLRLDRGQSNDLESRFRREAMVLSKLDHPSIVQVHDFGMYEGCPYLIREFVDGKSLGQVLASAKAYSAEDAVPLLVQLCEALEHAHQAGVIHRNLTPSKVIISADGRARIADFGLARLLLRGDEDRPRVSASVPGAIVDAPEYAAPEVLLGQAIDRRADLYSLGVIAYRMIAKKLPHAGSTVAEVISSRAHTKLLPLAEAAKLKPEALRFASVVDRLLEADPQRRCSSASWVAHALRVSLKETGPITGDGSVTIVGDATPVPPPLPKVEAIEIEARDIVAKEIASLPNVALYPELGQMEDTSLPDVSVAAVLVADPNYTLPGRPVEHAKKKERPHAQLAMPVRQAPLAQIWDALGNSEDAATKGVGEITATAIRPSSLEEDGIDATVAKPDVVLYLERARDAVVPALRKAQASIRPAIERLQLAERTQGLRERAGALRTKLGLPRLSRVQQLAVAAAAVVLLFGVFQLAGGPDSAPLPPEQTNAQLAGEARALAKAGKAVLAIEKLEHALVVDEKYGDPALHAALANAYVRSGQGAHAVQHYGIAVHKEPSVVDDGDISALVGLLGLPKPDGDKVAELVRELGDRAVPTLKAISEDKGADKNVRKRAKELLRSAPGTTPAGGASPQKTVNERRASDRAS